MGVLGALGALNPTVMGFAQGALDVWGQNMSRRENKDAMYHQEGFQRDMSNTSYQRAVQDMMTAGLNPMLAYSQGGASTPSGAPLHSTPVEFGKPVGSAMAAQRLSAEVDAIKAGAEKSRAERDLVLTNIPRAAAEARTAVTSAHVAERTVGDMIDKVGGDAEEYRARRPWAQRRANIEASTREKEHGLRASEEQIRNTERNVAMATWQDEIRRRIAERVLTELEVPAARNRAQSERTWWGEKVRPYLGDVGSLTNSAAAVRRAVRR